MSEETLKNVVLVHGGLRRRIGAGQGVYDLLTAAGDAVKVVQNPTVSLAGDVAATKMAGNRRHLRADALRPSRGRNGSGQPASGHRWGQSGPLGRKGATP